MSVNGTADTAAPHSPVIYFYNIQHCLNQHFNNVSQEIISQFTVISIICPMSVTKIFYVSYLFPFQAGWWFHRATQRNYPFTYRGYVRRQTPLFLLKHIMT